jgi:hypothetical protein
MTPYLVAVFQRADQYEGVRRINIYLLRVVYILMFFLLGKDTWTHVPTHRGSWEPTNAVPWGYVYVNYIYKPKKRGSTA